MDHAPPGCAHAVFPARNDLGRTSPAWTASGFPPPAGRAHTPQPEEPDDAPNVMEVDLEALAAGAESEETAWLARYFDSVTPTKKNEYTGRFGGTMSSS